MHGAGSQSATTSNCLQQQELLDPHRQTARRHTFNNVLSTISPMQHQNLQHIYQNQHPASPRHSPQPPINHPNSSFQQQQLQQQQHCSNNGLQWQPTMIQNNSFHHQQQQQQQLQQQRPRVLQPQPQVTQPQPAQSTEQRPWRQGRLD